MYILAIVDIYLQNLGEKKNTHFLPHPTNHRPIGKLGQLALPSSAPVLPECLPTPGNSPMGVPGCPDQLLEIAAGCFLASKKKNGGWIINSTFSYQCQSKPWFELWICNINLINHYMLLHFLHYKVACLHVFSEGLDQAIKKVWSLHPKW